MPIPRIIHQVWFKIGQGPATPPREYDDMRTSWTQAHPDWVFMQWDLEKSRTFLSEYYPEYVVLFDSYKRAIHKIDAIRYFILHHYGGFYVDTDVTCYQSIEPLRRHKVVLATNRYIKQGLIIHNNHFMGSIPKSVFFRDCIERLPSAALLQSNTDSFVSVMSVAGPFFLSTVASFHRKKGEIYVVTHAEEEVFLHHHEEHSWKVTRSIISDVGRASLAVGGITAGVLLAKYILDTRTRRF